MILGAGPAGIATAVALARHGVPFTLLERGERAAAGLRGLDPEMELLSPLRLSLIEGMRREPGDPVYPRFDAYADKLERVLDERGIEVVTGAHVTRVERSADGFRVLTESDAVFEGTHVVNATGISTHPRLPPEFDPTVARYRWLHSVDARTSDVESSRRLLVVGSGQSAVEVLERWLDVRRPDDRAWVSVRSPSMTFPHWLLGVDLHYLVWPFEFLPTRWLPTNPAAFQDPTLGFVTRKARRDGTITELSVVRSWEADGVRTGDGTFVEPDLVVFATGFEYALDHLGDLVDRDRHGWPRVASCESRKTPGLFLLGLRQCRSLASAYLRGIARDARAIAARIAR